MGIIGYFYPEVLYASVGYQLIQYVLNVRVFMLERTIESGNSEEHTVIKLGEIVLGYTIAHAAMYLRGAWHKA